MDIYRIRKSNNTHNICSVNSEKIHTNEQGDSSVRKDTILKAIVIMCLNGFLKNVLFRCEK